MRMRASVPSDTSGIENQHFVICCGGCFSHVADLRGDNSFRVTNVGDPGNAESKIQYKSW